MENDNLGLKGTIFLEYPQNLELEILTMNYLLHNSSSCYNELVGTYKMN